MTLTEGDHLCFSFLKVDNVQFLVGLQQELANGLEFVPICNSFYIPRDDLHNILEGMRFSLLLEGFLRGYSTCSMGLLLFFSIFMRGTKSHVIFLFKMLDFFCGWQFGDLFLLPFVSIMELKEGSLRLLTKPCHSRLTLKLLSPQMLVLT